MDAMKKKKVWRVAFAHFASTFICGVALIVTSLAFPYFPNSPKFLWLSFESTLFALLQPQFWIAPRVFTMENFYSFPLFGFSMVLAFYIISVPLWSYCFGLILVKLDNWLTIFQFSVEKFLNRKPAIVNRKFVCKSRHC